MKCFTCKNGTITPGIKVEKALISQGTKEIDAVQVGRKGRGGFATLVSVRDRGLPPDRILTNALNILTGSGKHGLSPSSPTERDPGHTCIVLFDTTASVGQDAVHLGERVKETLNPDGTQDGGFIPFPGTILGKGTYIPEGFPSGRAEQILALLPKGVVASISFTGRGIVDPCIFVLFDGTALHSATLSMRKGVLPPTHPLSPANSPHFLNMKD